MNSGIFFNSMIGNVYGHVWNKYRPVILKMMIASEEEPQQYKFSSHEFKGANPKEKGSFAFTLQAFQGKAVNNIRSSEIAQSLMSVLQQSKKATELLEKETYEFVMDKQFILHIKKQAGVLTPQ
ncbi:MAG TPA: hypothetical protein VGK39_04155 [Cyclobacteriaceae bacterium]